MLASPGRIESSVLLSRVGWTSRGGSRLEGNIACLGQIIGLFANSRPTERRSEETRSHAPSRSAGHSRECRPDPSVRERSRSSCGGFRHERVRAAAFFICACNSRAADLAVDGSWTDPKTGFGQGEIGFDDGVHHVERYRVALRIVVGGDLGIRSVSTPPHGSAHPRKRHTGRGPRAQSRAR